MDHEYDDFVIVWFEINNLMHYVQVVNPLTKNNVMTCQIWQTILYDL
jgi:hypothetical protein